MKEQLIKVLTSKQAKTLYWQVCVGTIGLTIAFLTGLNTPTSAVLIAVMNFLTKEINKRYL